MQCIIKVCSESNKIYTQYMHFYGIFHAKKTLASGAVPLRPASPQAPSKVTKMIFAVLED